jgi:hypothetical protein
MFWSLGQTAVMVLRINPARMPLWRNENELQLGAGTDAIRIKGLTAGQERLIKMLYRGLPDDFLDQAVIETGAGDVAELMKALEPTMLKSAGRPTSLSAEYVEQNFAEICRAQAMHSTEGQVVLEARHNSKVFIASCDGTETMIAESLGKASVGNIVLEASSEVSCNSRLFLLEELSEREVDSIDFAVLISQNAVSPATYKNWLGRSIAHVSIVFDSDGVTVSPIIEAGKTPCLNCFHEAQTRSDPSWPAIASQLLFSNQRFDDVTARLFAASLACQRVLQKLDSQSGFAIDDTNTTGYRLSIASGKITEFSWSFDEACRCVVRAD